MCQKCQMNLSEDEGFGKFGNFGNFGTFDEVQ